MIYHRYYSKNCKPKRQYESIYRFLYIITYIMYYNTIKFNIKINIVINDREILRKSKRERLLHICNTISHSVSIITLRRTDRNQIYILIF